MFPRPKATSAARNLSVTLIGCAAASHCCQERALATVPIGTLGLLPNTSFWIVPPDDMTISLQDHSLRVSHLCDITTGAILVGTFFGTGVRKFLRNF